MKEVETNTTAIDIESQISAIELKYFRQIVIAIEKHIKLNQDKTDLAQSSINLIESIDCKRREEMIKVYSSEEDSSL